MDQFPLEDDMGIPCIGGLTRDKVDQLDRKRARQNALLIRTVYPLLSDEEASFEAMSFVNLGRRLAGLPPIEPPL